ncbi:MAG TPA: hypothetical protein VH170_05930 [Chthoniobacterales bacterium]|jgi:hypothetical protein|nr:hypothetical protein [Chthoniobacterales bacterium]
MIILIAALAACIYQPDLSASLVIDDTFTGPDNTALVGRLPSPTNVPGNSYDGNGNVSTIGGPTGGTPYEADIQNNAAVLGGDAGVAVNLNIATPQQFQLSIDFNISANTQTQADNAHRGAALGFSAAVAIGSGGASHGFNNFTGLTVDTTGSVRLIIGGADSGIFTTVAGFNSSVTHTLTYQVNTTSGVGTISNIVLDSASITLTAPINTFTLARTVYAGFYNSSGGNTDLATFDNFSVAIVPEPAPFAAVVIFVLLACIADYRFARDPIRAKNESLA